MLHSKEQERDKQTVSRLLSVSEGEATFVISILYRVRDTNILQILPSLPLTHFHIIAQHVD